MIDGPIAEPRAATPGAPARPRWAARTSGMAFEVDGGVVVEGGAHLPGEVVDVRVTGAAAYDLFARSEPPAHSMLNILKGSA